MPKKHICLLTLLILLTGSAWAQAAPLAINITAQKETVSIENGTEIRRLLPATETQSGEIIFFTLNYSNSGEQTIRNVVLDDPIPEGMTYLPGTIWGEDADILFSIDQGASYKKPSLLTYEFIDAQGVTTKRMASPEEYTNIRWVISEVASGSKGQVGFKIRVR